MTKDRSIEERLAGLGDLRAPKGARERLAERLRDAGVVVDMPAPQSPAVSPRRSFGLKPLEVFLLGMAVGGATIYSVLAIHSSPPAFERPTAGILAVVAPDAAPERVVIDSSVTSHVPSPAVLQPASNPRGLVTSAERRADGVRAQDGATPDASAPSAVPQDATEGTREHTLIDAARVASRDGRPRDALVALFEHERRFPRGELVQERELLIIRALRASGMRVQMHTRARAFLSVFPVGSGVSEVSALLEANP